MADTPFLSIIIPVYNTEAYLPECVESILKQELKEYEILLVDDGSTDGSPAICDRYCAKYSHIRCIHQKNSGHTAARQAGFLACKGAYVAFADSDDWVSPVMYTQMCRTARESGADIIHCNFIAVMPDQEKKNTVPFAPGYYDKRMLLETVYPKMIYSGTWFTFGAGPNLWNKLFRRSLLEKFLFEVPTDIRVGEDWLTTYPCMLAAESVYFLEEAYYYYRSRSGSMKHHMDQNRLPDLHRFLTACRKAVDADRYPYMAGQVDYFCAYQSMQTLIPVFQDRLYMSGNDNTTNHSPKKLFRRECSDPQIRQSFRAVKIGDINGLHNKLYALCIRCQLYYLFRIALKI